MKQLLLSSLLALIGTSATAQENLPPITTTQGTQVYAEVVYVSPIYENVVIGRNCQPVQVVQPQSYGGTVVGGIIGGVIGSRFGGGTGRIVSTGVGAVTGATIGSIHDRQPSQVTTQVQCTPLTRLQHTANSYVAEYRGAQFSGVTYRPIKVGDKVIANVTVYINPGQ